MSARELRALSATHMDVSPPKRKGRKRLQSNADEATSKRTKTTNNDASDEESGGVGQQSAKKVKGKGTAHKVKKGKKSRCVAYLCEY